ncbi:MAG: hypothetical protein JWN37_411 [Candidatus Nomurabacteria bacterium]|nr:hypothetical protein [Candidatus Nomurabacteria bacterium]
MDEYGWLWGLSFMGNFFILIVVARAVWVKSQKRIDVGIAFAIASIIAFAGITYCAAYVLFWAGYALMPHDITKEMLEAVANFQFSHLTGRDLTISIALGLIALGISLAIVISVIRGAIKQPSRIGKPIRVT